MVLFHRVEVPSLVGWYEDGIGFFNSLDVRSQSLLERVKVSAFEFYILDDLQQIGFKSYQFFHLGWVLLAVKSVVIVVAVAFVFGVAR